MKILEKFYLNFLVKNYPQKKIKNLFSDNLKKAICSLTEIIKLIIFE